MFSFLWFQFHLNFAILSLYLFVVKTLICSNSCFKFVRLFRAVQGSEHRMQIKRVRDFQFVFCLQIDAHNKLETIHTARSKKVSIHIVWLARSSICMQNTHITLYIYCIPLYYTAMFCIVNRMIPILDFI